MYRSPPCAEGVGRYLKVSQITIFKKLIGVTTCNIVGTQYWLITFKHIVIV